MTLIVALWLALVAPPTARESARFAQSAAPYLSTEAAAWHLVAARAAGIVYSVRPELLLAIAYHESRYASGTRTRESGGRESCGVMTPSPKARCAAVDLTVLGGYDAGASHLRLWLTYCAGYEVCALRAYAGGGGLVRACAQGPWHTPRGTDACSISAEFQRRAALIRRALTG